MRRKKRKSFANVFWEKFFWITALLAVLYLLGMTYFVTTSKEDCWDGFWDVENTRVDKIKEHAEGGMETFGEKQQYFGAMMAEMNQVVSVVYDQDTKEQIAGCEEQLIIMRSKTDEEAGMIYCYPTADIPGWDVHRQQVMKLKKTSALVTENVEMPYFYQKDEEVIPGPFTVSVSVIDLFAFEMATEGYDPKQPLVRGFDTAGLVGEGFEQIKIGEGAFVIEPIIIGYSDTNPWLQKYGGIDRAYELLQKEYTAVKQEGKKIEGSEYWTYFTLTMKNAREVELDNGQTVVLYSVACYDLWESYKIIFLAIAGALLLFAVILALVLAKISYARIKAAYRMEDYRKNLMNTMAHDLKSPLMSISGYAENLANHMAPDKQEHYANAILENVQYMNEIVESVLALSKTEQVGIPLNKELVNLENLLKEVQKRYELQIEEKMLQIDVTGQLALKADKSLMLQMLDNLLSNAVKYATLNSVVQVEFNEKYLQMQNACTEDLSDVADTLCEPFVVGSKSRSGKKGSGMGLAIVKNICELHGFELQVHCGDEKFTVRIRV